jgi:CRISPR-associated protein Csb2
MSSILRLSVFLLDPFPSFHGRADAGEPEWPPSPLRFFQALVAAAASRWPGPRFKEYAGPMLDWLQKQDAPIIVAPKPHVGLRSRIAVPNNDMDVPALLWAKNREPQKPHRPIDLKTMKTVHPTWLRLEGSPSDGGQVHYLFLLASADQPDLEALAAAARSVTHLGWGMDMAVADVSVVSKEQAAALPGERWHPVDTMGSSLLRIPVDGTLDALIDRHQAFLNRIGRDGNGDESFNPVPPLSAFRVVDYRRAGEPAPRPFVPFELRRDDGPFVSYPQDKFIHIAGMVRHLAIKAMKKSPPEGVDSGWVETYVAGHVQAGAVGHRQFSYLPLPSIGHAHVDPSVRRVIIAAPPGDERLLQHLAMRLDGQRLQPTPETKLEHSPTLVRVRHDKVVRLYTEASNVWATVTPVILPGHDDHKPGKTRRLIEKALAQSGIEQSCEFEWSALSRFPKSLSSHKHDHHGRPIGYIRPGHLLSQTAVHLKVRFNEYVRMPGPLVVGAGRHCGFGLMAGINE